MDSSQATDAEIVKRRALGFWSIALIPSETCRTSIASVLMPSVGRRTGTTVRVDWSLAVFSMGHASTSLVGTIIVAPIGSPVVMVAVLARVPGIRDSHSNIRSGGLSLRYQVRRVPPASSSSPASAIHHRAWLLHWATRPALRLDGATLRLGVYSPPGLPRPRSRPCDAGDSGVGPPRSMPKTFHR